MLLIDTVAIILSGKDCAILNQAANLKQLRIHARGRDEHLYQLLRRIYETELKWKDSATGKQQIPEPEIHKTSNWFTPQHLAKTIGVSDRTIRNDINANRLPAQKIQGRWMIHEQDLETYLNARKAA